MVNIKNFNGDLLVPLTFRIQLPQDETVATTAKQTEEIDIELFPAELLAIFKNKLPVLKNINMYHEYPSVSDMMIAVADGYLEVMSYLFNAKSENVPQETDLTDGIPQYNCLGGCQSYAWTSSNHSSDVETGFSRHDMDKDFGQDGILMNPTLCAKTRIDNTTGSTIALNSFVLVIEMALVFQGVTQAEFDEYLREQYFIQAVAGD